MGIVHVFQPDAAMYGEVVHALFALFDKRVAEQLPGQVLGLSLHFFHSLVHRHGADRHRAVTHNPFARLMDIVACREVHQRVASPFAAP